MIYLVTRNPGKLLAAKSIFDRFNIELRSAEHDYEEIQGETSAAIARWTAVHAARELGAPALREDHSLFFNAVPFPGPYANYFEKKMPPDLLLKVMAPFNDRKGYFEMGAVYAEPSGFTKEFVYQVPVELAREPRGKLQSGWARLLMLEGEHRTFAEYPESERVHVWNKNYEAVAQFISTRK